MSVLLDSCILIDFLLGHQAAREYVSRLDGAAISFDDDEPGVTIPYLLP